MPIHSCNRMNVETSVDFYSPLPAEVYFAPFVSCVTVMRASDWLEGPVTSVRLCLVRQALSITHHTVGVVVYMFVIVALLNLPLFYKNEYCICAQYPFITTEETYW